MATRPELREAVAGTKNKASDYNYNNSILADYTEAVSSDVGTLSSVVAAATTSVASLDAATVKLTGSQTISGSKTFSNTILFNNNVTVTGDSFEFTRCTVAPSSTSSASNSKVAVVVQNYKSGTSWYRVWSDGFKEQGGVFLTPSSGGNATVSLLKNYTSTDYTILISQHTSNASDTGGSDSTCMLRNIVDTTKTTSSFSVSTINNRYLNWVAYGY